MITKPNPCPSVFIRVRFHYILHQKASNVKLIKSASIRVHPRPIPLHPALESQQCKINKIRVHPCLSASKFVLNLRAGSYNLYEVKSKFRVPFHCTQHQKVGNVNLKYPCPSVFIRVQSLTPNTPASTGVFFLTSIPCFTLRSQQPPQHRL